MLVSAQDGMGWITPEEMALIAEGNLYTVSLRDTQQTTVRRWIHNAGAKISLFVQGVENEINLKLITSLGHARIWTQAGDVEIVGDKDVNIHANTGKLHFVAEEELLATCAGAYLRLKGGVIDLHAPGKITMKAASFQLTGPASMAKEGKSPEPKSCGGQDDSKPYAPIAFVEGAVDAAIGTALGAALGSVAGALSGAGSLTGAAGSLTGAAGSLAGQASSALGSVKGMAGNAMSAVQGAAGNALGAVQGAAGNALGAVQGAAGNALGAVQGAAGNALGGAGDALKNVTSATDSVVGDASKSLTEAIPKNLPGKKPGT
jgi:hypothetical protein